MTWLDATPTVGVALAVLLAPGVLVAAVAGLRGVLLAGVAPVASTAVVAVAAVAADLVGVRLGLLPVLATTAVATALVGIGRALGSRVGLGMGGRPGSGRSEREGSGRHTGRGEEARATLAGLAGALVGAALTAVGMALGIGRPDHWPQQFDAVFHLSAVEHVVETGEGSALTLGTLVAPELSRSFYPAAWHDLAGLVGMVTGTPTPVLANVVAVVAAAVVWPLGCVALARVAVGPRPTVLLGAGVLAAGLTASPVLLSSYGTLWPNALATALLPAALALVVTLCAIGEPRAVGAAPGVILLLGCLAGLGLTHPNAVVTLLVLAAPALLVGTWSRGVRWRVGSAAWTVAVGWLVMYSPAFDGQRATSWPARQSLPQAAGEWLALAPQHVPVPYAVAGLALVGCVVAWRRERLRWLLAVHVVAGALFVLVAGSDEPLSRLVSAAWWDDAFRTAALAGVAGVPLAAIGLDAVARRLVGALRGGVRATARPALALALTGFLAVVGVAVHVPKTSVVMGWWYSADPLLAPDEAALLERLPTWVEPGERVVGNPWNGAALTGPLGDREAVFPHLSGRWDPDRALVARALSSAATRPDVCAAVDRLGIGLVVTNTARFWAGDPRRETYAGLDVDGIPGFEPVARGGDATAWRITACAP